ncbi:TetR/AcrR family transcriptional regulator [Streptomyces sp. CBMA123]|uniref:TetR/AcrR family transcriptional regulator n=1 Tax=Streptomyces sp. CBMA123 TaxID=1896313 RepID=UPI001661F5A1|nr:TetR/AcrR family transcriptional regulator [Streptomyces sp. CBMA123]MBD0690985.1 TetR family transcriptional regulator [Streptomyces sp. CBMA123]
MTATSEDDTPPEHRTDAQPDFPSPWNRPQKRRTQPALSREQIVAEAFALLDSDGIEALSMRKLGARLNAGATSLYTHVANKDELLALVVDHVFGELPLARAEGAEDPKVWRAAIVECTEGMRAAIVRHPWMVSVIGDVGMVYLGPNWMRLSEALLVLMETAGFDLGEASDVMSVVTGYTIGTATVEAAWLSALTKSGQGEQEFMDRLLPAVVDATRPYPRLHRLYTTEVPGEIEAGRDSSFRRGLDVILDGIEARRSTS